jgi:hypothetical protein
MVAPVIFSSNANQKRVSLRPWSSLLATTNDLRRYPRVPPPKGTVLAWSTVNQRLVSRVENFALGGLFIHIEEPLPLDTNIQLLLDAPEGEIRARAVVRRTTPKEGMGVKIVAMNPEDRARLMRWLDNLSVV